MATKDSSTQKKKTLASLVALTAATAVLLIRRVVERRRRRAAAAKRVKSECAALVRNEGLRRSLVDDALAHLAVEGSLLLALDRDKDGKIDYGAATGPPDPRLKLNEWYATPTAALPAPLPRTFFERARRASVAMARLVDKAATNHAWLRGVFGELATFDDWTARMLRLAKLDDGGRRLRCHVIRSDYMCEKKNGAVMIETNTFAASLAGPAVAASRVHRRLLHKYSSSFSAEEESFLDDTLPRNGAANGIADALAAALRAYERTFLTTRTTTRPVVLFVTVAEEDNELCHRHLERRLQDAHGISSLRRTVGQLRLVGDDQIFRVDGQEVGVAYFRLCAWERRGEAGWAVREALARCRCVEVPSAAAHLAGLKRAQVEWSRHPEQLVSATDAAVVRDVSATQFALDDPDDAKSCLSTVLLHDSRFVAKAARDGRAHVFDTDAIVELARHAASDKKDRTLARSYVVQRLATPLPRDSLVPSSSDDLAFVRPSVPELGFFVGFVPSFSTRPSVLGHLVRSKHVDTADGGLCRGNAIVDSPLLYDDDDDDD